MAVIIPFSGVTPEAIPNAMARGRATIPTMIPAMRSDMNVFLLYVFRQENKLDLIAIAFITFFKKLYCIFLLSKNSVCKGTTNILNNKMFFNVS